jgi:hypothetical protein
VSGSVHRAQQALARGLHALSTDAIEGRESVEADDFPLASTEMVQRLHVPVEGAVGRSVVYTTLDVDWPYPFLNLAAANQHESDQEQPHFVLGVEVLTEEPVMLDAQVRAWQQDERGFYTGATVRFSAWSPEAIKVIKYSAVMHLTFMGYGAASEDDNEG